MTGVDAHGGSGDENGAALIAENATQLAKDGYTFVAAYIDQNDTNETPGTTGFEQSANGPAPYVMSSGTTLYASLTAGEAQTIEAAGLQIVSIFETNGEATSPYYGSSNSTTAEIQPYLTGMTDYNGVTVSQGYADGEEALASAKAIGQPTGSAIYFAFDFDPGPGNYFPGLQQAVETYLNGVTEAFANSGYAIGVYGAAQTLEWATTDSTTTFNNVTYDYTSHVSYSWLSGSSGWAGYGPPGTEGSEIYGPGGATNTHGWSMLQTIPGDPADTNPNEQSGTPSGTDLSVDYDASENDNFGQWPPICYCRGTRILTERGEVAIEALEPGDRVMGLLAGTLLPVRWIGSRSIDIGRHPEPEWVQPIRIQAGAFGPGLPHRDLLVSPDHAVYVDGCLIPARLLRNDATIRRELQLGKVDYFHVELDRHDVVVAEGLPTESYLDTGNRAFFDNAEGPVVLYPNLAEEAAPAVRAALSCAPFVTDPARVEPIWRDLAERATQLGLEVTAAQVTSDAGLRLRVGGRDIAPIEAGPERVLFPLPPAAARAQIVSRAGRPSDVRRWLDDRRCLGVAVTRLRVHGEAGMTDLSLDNPNLTDGWWDAETVGSTKLRWTNGAAQVALPPDATCLELRLRTLEAYPALPAADGVQQRGSSGARGMTAQQG